MGRVGVSASLLPPRAAPGVTRVSALPAGPRGRRGTMALAVGSVAPLHPAPAPGGAPTGKQGLVQRPVTITRDGSPTGEFTTNGLSREKLLLRVNHPLER